jgi:hypothetical protein
MQHIGFVAVLPRATAAAAAAAATGISAWHGDLAHALGSNGSSTAGGSTAAFGRSSMQALQQPSSWLERL